MYLTIGFLLDQTSCRVLSFTVDVGAQLRTYFAVLMASALKKHWKSFYIEAYIAYFQQVFDFYILQHQSTEKC